MYKQLFSIICLFCFCLQTYAEEKIKTLTPFLTNSSKPTAAVIVCPGGSYCWPGTKTEGTEVAQWLQANGISTFVLKYRVQGIVPYITHSRLLFRGHQHPDAINDLQQAISYVREHADEYNINPQQLGLMGFSAGGHLAMLGATSANFVAAVYPVVSMSHPDSHKRSRRGLLGEYRKRNKAMRDSLSIEKHIPKNCPPVFLVNCKDDHTVKPRNSELLDSALTAQGISHRYIQYQTGGHGFGASDTKGTAECRAWKNEFLNWIKSLGL